MAFRPDQGSLPPASGSGWSFNTLQWQHGDKSRPVTDWQHFGGFFSEIPIPEGAAVEAGEIHACHLRIVGDNAPAPIPGFTAPRLRANVLRWRSCWFREDDRGRVHRFATYKAADEADVSAGGARSHVQIVLRFPGSRELFCLTIKGWTAAAFVQSGKDEKTINEQIRDRLTETSQRHLRQQGDSKARGLPISSWWIVLGAKFVTEGEGEKAVTTVVRATVGAGRKKAEITPLFLLDPAAEIVDEEGFEARFIGNPLQKANAEAWTEYTPWVNEWRALPGGAPVDQGGGRDQDQGRGGRDQGRGYGGGGYGGGGGGYGGRDERDEGPPPPDDRDAPSGRGGGYGGGGGRSRW